MLVYIKVTASIINSSGRVMINSLDSTRSNYNGYRENSLLAAKRIIGADDDPGIVTYKVTSMVLIIN